MYCLWTNAKGGLLVRRPYLSWRHGRFFPTTRWLASHSIALLPLPCSQKEVVTKCRRLGKPVIVASHLLQSMHTLPTPTRAEVGCHCWWDVCSRLHARVRC